MANLSGKRATFFAGVFFLSLSVLAYEITLARILSVTMWRHQAFMAISLVMFGLAAGSACVFARPGLFPISTVWRDLSVSGLLFSAAVAAVTWSHTLIPIASGGSFGNTFILSTIYLWTSIPFFFAGVGLCLAVTRFPDDLKKIYAADLAGGALGCLLPLGLLNFLDGPTAALFTAVMACLAATLFAQGSGSSKLVNLTRAALGIFVIWTAWGAAAYAAQEPLMPIRWTKGKQTSPAIYERWNSFSYIRVYEDPKHLSEPFGWGLSQEYVPNQRPKQLRMDIDATGITVLTEFHGDPESVDHLRYDVTNVVHYLKRDADVLMLGAGGGKDILAALVFGQKKVVAVDVNHNILNAVNDRFGEFTGHLDRRPDVTFVVKDARSYVSSSREQFDIVQLSFSNNMADIKAGSLLASDYPLLTREAWKLFLERLKPDGILSYSCMYAADGPAVFHRVVSLARSALEAKGIADTGSHLAVIGNLRSENRLLRGLKSVATLLVKMSPFTAGEIAELESIADRLGYNLLYTPRSFEDKAMGILARGEALPPDFPVDVSAPTDDKPFFFSIHHPKDLFLKTGSRQVLWSRRAMREMIALFFVVVGLSLIFIIGPVSGRAYRRKVLSVPTFFVYFLCIGFGFMFIEISQLERFMIFLGHPSLGVAAVLFAMFFGAGLGSLFAAKRSAVIFFGIFILFDPGALWVTTHFIQSPAALKFLWVVALLTPLSFLMGMLLPRGMAEVFARFPEGGPWYWALNAAASVCAPVLATLILVTYGMRALFWAGVFCYAIAYLAQVKWVERVKEGIPSTVRY